MPPSTSACPQCCSSSSCGQLHLEVLPLFNTVLMLSASPASAPAAQSGTPVIQADPSDPSTFNIFLAPLQAFNDNASFQLLGNLAGAQSPAAVQQLVGAYLQALAAANSAPLQGRLGRVEQSGNAAYRQATPEAFTRVGSTQPLGKLLHALISEFRQQPGIHPVPPPIKGASPYVQSYGGYAGASSSSSRSSSRSSSCRRSCSSIGSGRRRGRRRRRPRCRRFRVRLGVRVRGGLRLHRHGQAGAADFCTKQTIRETLAGQERISACIVVSAADADGLHRTVALGHTGRGSATVAPPVDVYVYLLSRDGVGNHQLPDGSRLLHGTCEGAPPLMLANGDAACLFEVRGRGVVASLCVRWEWLPLSRILFMLRHAVC